MELALLALIPFIFLLVAASLLVISQISSFLQFSRFSRRERNNNDIISKYIQEMALAQTQLGKRSRQLEELSRRLKLGNEELARMNSMKSKFLSMAVHDIRTPLTSVRGFSEMLERKGSLGAQERKYLTYIMRATDQIGHLMADLTDLAVIEAGKFRIEKTSLDLAEFVAEALPSIGLIASRKGVILTAAEVPAGVEIEADRFRLGRVLANLLGNAVKFTQPGGRVELRTRVLGPTVIFSIKDTGPGIHPSERRKIFEKFYQSQFMRDVKSRSAGWGLGLAISQEIVRAHSGEIGVDSQGLGKGSTFWVRVPLRAAVRRAAAVAAVALAALVLSGPARAQTIPLDEKAKFEAALEKKAEGVLLRVLGPNRYKVVVDAAVDFTRIEKFGIKEGSVTQRSERSGPYAW
ncbi:MAG: hypothetical protein HYZ74_00275, partial [Elusimicrobia bacterium]|nr:hypothetical protein [Elusimicrobiota bacterium]